MGRDIVPRFQPVKLESWATFVVWFGTEFLLRDSRKLVGLATRSQHDSTLQVVFRSTLALMYLQQIPHKKPRPELPLGVWLLLGLGLLVARWFPDAARICFDRVFYDWLHRIASLCASASRHVARHILFLLIAALRILADAASRVLSIRLRFAIPIARERFEYSAGAILQRFRATA
ncbi:MAG: hypothetical protein KBG84_15045 [Planctomycetes bacterium]|nr:hypothetical protein [Planctomycetota bacterium]